MSSVLYDVPGPKARRRSLIISVFIILIILMTQFNSVGKTLIIMSEVVFSIWTWICCLKETYHSRNRFRAFHPLGVTWRYCCRMMSATSRCSPASSKRRARYWKKSSYLMCIRSRNKKKGPKLSL